MATVIKCKMCGGDLNLIEGSSTAQCEFCGSLQTVPSVDDDKKITLFGRANRLRAGCEFDKAAGVYESIVADFPEEAEAYWGLVLCKYGIEYVDDPATGKKVPTCHRSSFDSVMEDPNFEQALENADEAALRVYREEAKQIEEIRKGIIEVSAKEDPYDIFICYKETDKKGDRTVDSLIAQDIYDTLTEKGYRVFFSRITLEDKLGVAYEPYIFAALNSAKVMLAIGTDYENYNAVWVKNEWSRFLKLMEKDKRKHLIPCYKDIDAYDIPKEFKHLQAQDMGKVGAMQDLVRGIDKILTVKEEKQQVTVHEGMSKEEKKALNKLQRGQKISRSIILGLIFMIAGFFAIPITLNLPETSPFYLVNEKYVVGTYQNTLATMADIPDNMHFGIAILGFSMLFGLSVALMISWGFRSKVTSWTYLLFYTAWSAALIYQKLLFDLTLGPVLYCTFAALAVLSAITTLTVYFKHKKAMTVYLIIIALIAAAVVIL